MKRLSFLMMSLALVCSASAQSILEIAQEQVCWSTPGGADSSLTRYVLISTRVPDRPRTLCYVDENGQIADVSGGGSFTQGFCGCCAGGSGSGSDADWYFLTTDQTIFNPVWRSGRVAIGTMDTSHQLQLQGDWQFVPDIFGSRFDWQNTTDTTGTSWYGLLYTAPSGLGGSSNLSGGRNNLTLGTQSTVIDRTRLGVLAFAGNNPTDTDLKLSAFLDAVADGAWTGSNTASHIDVWVTAPGETFARNTVTFQGDGRLELDRYFLFSDGVPTSLLGFNSSTNDVSRHVIGGTPAPGSAIVVNGAGSGLEWGTGGGGGGTTMVYDNYRLPAIHEYFPATGLNANESVANYSFSSVNPTFYKFSTIALGSSSTDYGGWLANGTSGDSIAISAPFGVVIGDSQAEGHPARHGRLHPNGVATFSVNYQDSIGTISYTLRQLTNMRWFNHGIGSQTTDQVWARWRRDVLAKTFDPGDGRGAKTLQRKPQFVIIIAGINDFYVYNRSWVATAINLELMVQSARDNGIVPVVLNCPGDEIISLAQAQKIDSLNRWIASGALQAFGAAVIDYNTWWRDSSYNDNAHGNSLLADFIHPSEVGYDTLANIIFRAAKLPVLSGIKFTNQLSPLGFSGYSRPSSITIQGESYTISSDNELITFSTPMAWDSVWINIQASTNITGTTYSGFSHIQWLYSNDTTGVVTKRNELYQGYQGSSASIWGLSGSVISPANTANRLAVGTASAPAATTVFTVQGTTTDATINSQWQSSTGLNPIVFTNNGRVGINRSSAIHNLHVGGTMMSETAAGYSFWNGPTSQMFAFQPRIQMQSTGVNTGGTGRTDADISFDGSNFVFAPASSASGANIKYLFRNKLSTYAFVIDVNTGKFGNVNPPVYSVDFSGSVDGINIPRGGTSQRGSTGTFSPLRFNMDSLQAEFSKSASTWTYLPQAAYPRKFSGLTSWQANSELGTANIGNGLTFSSNTLSVSAYQTDTIPLSGSWVNITDLTAYKQLERVTLSGVLNGETIPGVGTIDITSALPTAYRLTLGGFSAVASDNGVLKPVFVQMVTGTISVASGTGAAINLSDDPADALIIQNTYYKN